MRASKKVLSAFEAPPICEDLVSARFARRGPNRKQSTRRGRRADGEDNCIRIIVGKDFAEVCARFGHRLGPGLAEPDPVSLADSSQNGLPAFFLHDEVITWDGAPA